MNPDEKKKLNSYVNKSKSFSVPQRVRKEAERGLELRKKHNKGGLDTKQAGKAGIGSGVARAASLKKGSVTYDTIKRMLAFFRRHEKYKKQGYHKDRKSASYISWLLWGGDAGYSWARKIVRSEEGREAAALTAHSEMNQGKKELTEGKPFKTLSIGQVTSRVSGEPVGGKITVELLHELVRVFNDRKDVDPVIIDWNHNSSPFASDGSANIEASIALGIVNALKVENDSLMVYPSYTEKGLEIIRQSEGLLWSSPEFMQGEVFTRSGGEKIGDGQLLAVTLTPRPAQQLDKIQSIYLGEFKMDETKQVEEISKEELLRIIEDKDAVILELQEQLKDKQEDAILKVTPEELGEKMEKTKYQEEDKEKHQKEVSALTEMVRAGRQTQEQQNQKIALMTEEIARLRKKEADQERDRVIDQLFNLGQIEPHEMEAAKTAYSNREQFPSIWSLFSERQPNSKVPFNEVGYSQRGGDVNKQTVNKKIMALSEEQGLSYQQALNQFREQNEQEYNLAYRRN